MYGAEIRTTSGLQPNPRRPNDCLLDSSWTEPAAADEPADEPFLDLRVYEHNGLIWETPPQSRCTHERRRTRP